MHIYNKRKSMSVSKALTEWSSKKRRMGCVSASKWFCKRVRGFYSKRLKLFNSKGEYYEHVVVSNGIIEIDICPYANRSKRKYND